MEVDMSTGETMDMTARYENDLDCMVAAMRVLSDQQADSINRRNVVDVFLRWLESNQETSKEKRVAAVVVLLEAYDSKIQPPCPKGEESYGPVPQGFVHHNRG